MDGRHDLSEVYAAMENSGHSNSQQLRPPSYGDLCRPPGNPADPASTLSYHSRYLASLPLSTGSSFPFLGSMFAAGTMPAAPTTTSFRTPSTPGIGNMRQFWPPTPPPDGYGRYGLNTSLFPLFGSVSPSPESGTYMTQGLVSRLGAPSHLPHLIDNHKDQGFYPPGFSLPSSLTPSSYVTPSTPFCHLSPSSVDKHSSYGHIPLNAKDLEDHQDIGDLNSSKVHVEPYKPDKYSSSGRYKSDKTYEKLDFRKSSLLYPSKERQEDVKPVRRVDAKLSIQSPNKISPCEIDVSCSPSIKPDILSPPLDSPKSEVSPSPKTLGRKPEYPPVHVNSPTLPSSSTLAGKSETQCSTCAANIRGVGIATKLRANGSKKAVPVSHCFKPLVRENDISPATLHVDNGPSTISTLTTTTAALPTPQTASVDISGEIKMSDAKEVMCSAAKCVPGKQVHDSSAGNVFQESLPSTAKSDGQTPSMKSRYNIGSGKHITAAVIPTAPKQVTQRDAANYTISTPSSSLDDYSNHHVETSPNPVTSCDINNGKKVSILPSIKSEKTDSVPCNKEPSSFAGSNCSCYKHFHDKANSCMCKAKDKISAVEPQLGNTEDSQNAQMKRTEENRHFKMTPQDCPYTSATTIPTTACQVVLPSSPMKADDVDSSDSTDQDSPKHESRNNLKGTSPVNTYECKLSHSSNVQWTKATVSPYNWQKNIGNRDENQAINLTVSKSNKEESETSPAVTNGNENAPISMALVPEMPKEITETSTLASTGVVGVCLPNSTKVSASSPVNRSSCTPTLSQPEIVTELHSSTKSMIQMLRHNPTPPNTIKNSFMISSYQNKTLKTERMNIKKSKVGDTEKVLPRGNLATLAPKLTKKVGFLKEGKTSHTLSTSSSMSSTSIVFPASVNPCIPVGIAIAQQRQDSTTTVATSVGKTQTNAHSTSSGIVSSNGSSNVITAEVSPQEILRDQKIPQEAPGTADPANFLVTSPGSTILSRQWESEAVTRATLPSPWVAHGSIVAPALWIGQGAYTAAAAPNSTAVPSPLSTVEPSPISLPPGGYQLARDSITGHLFLIPAANIVDRTSVWPSYNPTSTTLPVQQLVSQQHHAQFEQVIPQVTEAEPVQDCLSLSVQHTHLGETAKEFNMADSCCLSSDNSLSNNVNFKAIEPHTKAEGKRDSSAPAVPLASGQTFTFTTFPTNCDPASFSYVLQSSTVMHLAHTQTTSSIQTESGKRSQGTSPLHCASPSPPPSNSATTHIADDTCEEESDNDVDSVPCSEVMQVKHSQSTAIQVDMDSQTNSEAEDEDESDTQSDTAAVKNVQMFDSANQTENDSVKCDLENESSDAISETASENSTSHSESLDEKPEKLDQPSEQDLAPKPVLQMITAESELAPSLPVESQPVMDFIDHHGLNLLVDSIEEFASREKVVDGRVHEKTLNGGSRPSSSNQAPKGDFASSETGMNNSSVVPFRTLDASCTDGLGLLCALAEQRFLEESLNTDTGQAQPENMPISNQNERSASTVEKDEASAEDDASDNDTTFYEKLQDSLDRSSPTSLRACELEMRKRLADLQRKYKEKELELARLIPCIDAVEKNDDTKKKYAMKSMNRFKKRMLYSVSKVKCQALPSFSGNTVVNFSQRSACNLYSKQLLRRNRLKRLNKSYLKGKRLSYFKKNAVINQKVQSTEDASSSGKDGLAHQVSAQLRNSSEELGRSVSSVPKVNLKKKPMNAKSDFKQKKEKTSEKTLKKDHATESKSKPTDNGTNEANGNSKVPFFDEQAWFIRRSERIFLNDARAPSASQHAGSSSTSKKSGLHGSGSKSDSGIKEKKESSIKLHQKAGEMLKASNNAKTEKEKDDAGKVKTKPPTKIKLKHSSGNSPAKRHSNSSDSSSSSSSDSESCGESSSQSDNLPLSVLFDQVSGKGTSGGEKLKRLSTDSDSSEASSALSEDIPLSMLLGQSNTKCEIKSCILTPAELQDRTRVLILDEGLFYAGHISAVQAPDVYGIILDGERAHRPHIFSREEILNAAVLEIKPTHRAQVPEGSRVCAFWSQQYRCLYPGTVVKASSPTPDPSVLYVEFDDGDSGRIPLDDIRLLPPEFPIVSLEPNPLLILGKRRARIEKENLNEQKISSSQKSDHSEVKASKMKKRRLDSNDGKTVQESKNSDKDSLCLSLAKVSKSSKSESLKSSSSFQLSKCSQKEGKSAEKAKSKDSDNENPGDMSGSKKICLSAPVKPKKHKKHKDDHKHHHHHHHHHHRHHHKKHKAQKLAKRDSSQDKTVISVGAMSPDSSGDSSVPSSVHSECHSTILCAEKKSELTVKIKTSPSPHTTHEQKAANNACADQDSSTEKVSKDKPSTVQKKSKGKKSNDENKPAKRKDRLPSVEKSKIAAFLPVRQLWRWSGKSYRRPGTKGKAKKEFYRAIQRGKELLRVGDCAVFLSTGRPHLPYIGRIETMWESWGGKMDVKVKWFYHPEETKSSKKLTHLKPGALFQSPHFDENDVQTISHKCEVLSWEEFQKKKNQAAASSLPYSSMFDNNDTYYLAGTYDPITGTLVMEPDIPKIPSLASCDG